MVADAQEDQVALARPLAVPRHLGEDGEAEGELEVDVARAVASRRIGAGQLVEVRAARREHLQPEWQGERPAAPVESAGRLDPLRQVQLESAERRRRRVVGRARDLDGMEPAWRDAQPALAEPLEARPIGRRRDRPGGAEHPRPRPMVEEVHPAAVVGVVPLALEREVEIDVLHQLDDGVAEEEPLAQLGRRQVGG